LYRHLRDVRLFDAVDPKFVEKAGEDIGHFIDAGNWSHGGCKVWPLAAKA
jgi:hypothetical protein